MDILKKLSEYNSKPQRQKQIKKYLIACCQKYTKYRSSGNLVKGIKSAKQYINGDISWEKFHDIEYVLEGEAFAIDFYTTDRYLGKYDIDKNMLLDLKKVRIGEQLNQTHAKNYLIDLAYFIDGAFNFCYFPDDNLPDNKYKKFLCPVLFKRYFS